MKTRPRDEFCRRGVGCILKSTWIEEAPSTAIALSTEQGCLDSA